MRIQHKHSAPAWIAQADCHDCARRDRSAWCGLSATDPDALNQAKQCRVFAPGQVIHQQGQDCPKLLVIQAGAVAVRRSDSAGRSILLRLSYTGDALGYRELLCGIRHSTAAEALVESRICMFDRRTVIDVLENRPELGARFLRSMGEDLEATESNLLRTATLPMRARVAHLLLALKDRFGAVGDGGLISLLLPLSRQDLADLIGVRRESIARAIHDLECAGIVRLIGHGITIPDLDLLMDEVESPER